MRCTAAQCRVLQLRRRSNAPAPLAAAQRCMAAAVSVAAAAVAGRHAGLSAGGCVVLEFQLSQQLLQLVHAAAVGRTGPAAACKCSIGPVRRRTRSRCGVSGIVSFSDAAAIAASASSSKRKAPLSLCKLEGRLQQPPAVLGVCRAGRQLLNVLQLSVDLLDRLFYCV